VINELDRDDASSVAIPQDIFKGSNELKVLKNDLAYIHADFSFVLLSTAKLEKATNLLSEATKEIEGIEHKLNKINGSKTYALKQKFRSCFSKKKSCARFHVFLRGKT
jgi:hypothetical protein